MRRLTITSNGGPRAEGANFVAEVLLISGVLNGSSLGQLRRAVDSARAEAYLRTVALPVAESAKSGLRPALQLDLSELVLADRSGLEYLARMRSTDVELVNVPDYIRQWIDPEPLEPAD